jgi:hypothetical protein
MSKIIYEAKKEGKNHFWCRSSIGNGCIKKIGHIIIAMFMVESVLRYQDMNDPNQQGPGLRSMHPDVEHTYVRTIGY